MEQCFPLYRKTESRLTSCLVNDCTLLPTLCRFAFTRHTFVTAALYFTPYTQLGFILPSDPFPFCFHLYR